MRVFHVGPERLRELDGLPDAQLTPGFLWLCCAREELESQVGAIQEHLQHWHEGQLVDLHISDLLNKQLPSHFDTTSWYDLLVFRRLATSPGADPQAVNAEAGAATRRALGTIDTRPVGFAVFDHVLVTVHPVDCAVGEHFAQRLAGVAGGNDLRGSARLPTSPADLMLRMVNHMVDNFLDLRRLLTRHLGQLQSDLLSPKGRFRDWTVLLDSRNTLHLLEDICDDQHAAIQEWVDALDLWPAAADGAAQRERELLRVRSRDVIEHIERVLAHVRRLEQSSENAVQMHYSALSHRTNDIMRMLTVLTAIFLPLNLVTGIFGMNFDTLPLIHSATGAWITLGVMGATGLGLGLFFWRKRYLSSRD